MTTKPTENKTPDAEELKDDELDKVQGGTVLTTNENILTNNENVDGMKSTGKQDGFKAGADLGSTFTAGATSRSRK